MLVSKTLIRQVLNGVHRLSTICSHNLRVNIYRVSDFDLGTSVSLTGRPLVEEELSLREAPAGGLA